MSKVSERKDHLHWLFSAMRLPGRITAEESAALLGFQTHDIPVLVGRGLLSPCGNAQGNCPKYFPAREVIDLCANVGWINKATKAIAQQWRKRNETTRNRSALRNGNQQREGEEHFSSARPTPSGPGDAGEECSEQTTGNRH